MWPSPEDRTNVIASVKAEIVATIATDLQETEAQQSQETQPHLPQARLSNSGATPSQVGSSNDSFVQPPAGHSPAAWNEGMHHLLDLLDAESHGLTVVWQNHSDRDNAIAARLAQFQDLSSANEIMPARPSAVTEDDISMPTQEADGTDTSQARHRERSFLDDIEVDKKRLRVA